MREVFDRDISAKSLRGIAEFCAIGAEGRGAELSQRVFARFSGWRFPEVPGAEIVQTIVGMTCGDRFEGGHEVGARFDVVHLGGLNWRSDEPRGSPALTMSGEGSVLAVEDNRADQVSTLLEWISTQPSVRKVGKPSRWLWMWVSFSPRRDGTSETGARTLASHWPKLSSRGAVRTCVGCRHRLR